MAQAKRPAHEPSKPPTLIKNVVPNETIVDLGQNGCTRDWIVRSIQSGFLKDVFTRYWWRWESIVDTWVWNAALSQVSCRVLEPYVKPQICSIYMAQRNLSYTKGKSYAVTWVYILRVALLKMMGLPQNAITNWAAKNGWNTVWSFRGSFQCLLNAKQIYVYEICRYIYTYINYVDIYNHVDFIITPCRPILVVNNNKHVSTCFWDLMYIVFNIDLWLLIVVGWLLCGEHIDNNYDVGRIFVL